MEELVKKYKKDLRKAFDVFVKFGSRNSNDGAMDGKTYYKLFKDCGLINKKFTSIDVDIIFAKYKPKNKRKIVFRSWIESLVPVAQARFPKLFAKGPEIALKNVILKIKKNGTPIVSATKTDYVRFHDDESSYTGKHKRESASTPVKKKPSKKVFSIFPEEEKGKKKAQAKKNQKQTKSGFYDTLLEAIKDKVDDEVDIHAVTGNVSSYLYWSLRKSKRQVNWVGFYVVKQIDNDQKDNKDDEDAYSGDKLLIVHGFQGKPAIMKIRYDTGVVGKCATTQFSIIVDNVHKFEGHIQCDIDTRSEIVVPVFDNEKELVAVLDIDCKQLKGFDETDQKYLEEIANFVGSACTWTNDQTYTGEIPSKEHGCKATNKKFKDLF